MKRILVTGGSGFVGRRCVSLLAESSVEVHVAGRSDSGWHGPRVIPHQVDLMAPDQVRRLMAAIRPTHLLHLAWVTTPGVYLGAPENLDWVAASLQIIRGFCEHGGHRAVLVGSCAEYEWAAETVCHETGTPYRPTTLYGTCKNALRAVAEAYARQSGLSAAWARLFYLYGPYEHPNRLVASVIRSLLTGDRARCTAGNQRRDFLHVWDAAEALVLLLDSELTGPINIASGEAVSVGTIVRMLGDLLGRPDLIELGAIAEPMTAPALLAADVTQLRRELNCRPQFTLQSGLLHTVGWWKSVTPGASD